MIFPLLACFSNASIYSQDVGKDGSTHDAQLFSGEGFEDVETGMEVEGPFLATDNESISCFFSQHKIEMLRIPKSIPFAVIIKHAPGDNVVPLLNVSTFPTSLYISSELRIRDSARVGLVYELEITSLESGKEQFEEVIHFYTPELPANESHDYNLSAGRFFLLEFDEKGVPNIRQLQRELDNNAASQILDSDCDDESKARQMKKFFMSQLCNGDGR